MCYNAKCMKYSHGSATHCISYHFSLLQYVGTFSVPSSHLAPLSLWYTIQQTHHQRGDFLSHGPGSEGATPSCAFSPAAVGEQKNTVFSHEFIM